MVSVKLTTGHYEAAGAALCGAGRPGLGADFFRAALSTSPRDPSLLTGLSGCLKQLGQLPEAETTLLEAIALEPTDKRRIAHAIIARDRGRDEESEQILRDALAADPDSADAAGFLGIWLLDRWRERDGTDEDLETGRRLIDQALETAPQNLSFQEGRLVALQLTERYAEWDAASEFALRVWPNYFRFQLNRAFAHLKLGRLAAGMRTLANSIPGRADLVDCPIFQRPAWHRGDGPGPLLVWNTDGVGDGIHLARYLKDAAAEGAEITVVANEPEERLMRSIPGVSAVVRPEDVVFGPYATFFGAAAEYLSDRPLWTGPYVTPEPEAVEIWRRRLAPITGFRVGVCWAGNPKQENNARRSFRVQELAALAKVPGVQLVSLQYGHDEDLVDADIWNLGEYYQAGDWLETAAVIANLDLVIAPCTGVAHLAGAMGKPVWLALSEPGCWRWGIGRKDSDWYPSMTIYRQSERGRWAGVFKRMTETLACYQCEAAVSPFPVRRDAEKVA